MRKKEKLENKTSLIIKLTYKKKDHETQKI